MISPLQLAFYRGAGGKYGAVQFNFRRPHYYCVNKDCKQKVYDSTFPPDKCPASGCTAGKMESREGALFIEITSAKGKNDYDWDRKIVMALSISDLSQLLMVLEGHQNEVELMHDPHAKTANSGTITKRLKLLSPKGIYTPGGGLLVTCSQSIKDGDTISHTVPLSPSEVKRLAVCIRTAIPQTLGWN